EARHRRVKGGELRLSGTNETPIERKRIVDRRAEQAGPSDVQGLDQSTLIEEKAVEADQHGDVVWRETAGLAQMRERRLRLIVAFARPMEQAFSFGRETAPEHGSAKD